VVFTLDRERYALPVRSVQRIARMVEVTPLPKAPEIVLGVVNLQGRIIPVMNLRRRFGLPERETSLSDQLVFAHTSTRDVALVVDSVTGVIERPANQITEVEKIVPGTEYVEGVAELDDGILLIHDLDGLLSLDEESRLADLLTRRQGASA
jgi:purine-binding chemotaxis protein CheW